jgi:hypothetical protein
MKLVIHDLFIDPPLAIARLGGSSIPQDPYAWAPAVKPRMGESTSIVPVWSLSVQQDGTVEPIMPAQVTFRDGPLIRPVCPFFEIWVRVGPPGSTAKSWQERPLTPSLLADCGATLADVSITVDAKNGKVARRTGNPNLKFGTFPPVTVRADVHTPVAILASSPNGVAQPMIPADRNIPLGLVQVMRSRPPLEKSDPRAAVVDVERIRFRFTPARGLIYGVPQAAQTSATPRGRRAIPVVKSRAFLNPLAGWAGASVNELVQPADTYDGADVGSNMSLGVIDDTCEAKFDVTLRVPGGKPAEVLSASAHAFVGPPDFAPDRRPFLSLADELNDRGSGSDTRTKAMGAADKDQWIQDLFERVFETASLFNVDLYRQQRAAPLTGSALRRTPLREDRVPSPSRAMGGRDALRNADVPPLSAPNSSQPLPLSERAVSRHRELSDLSRLRDFIQENPERIERLVRAPFDLHPGEDIDSSTMRMPPFMRNSNAEPLTLSVWQYQLLMSWVKQQSGKTAQQRPQTALRVAALKRRQQVLARMHRVAPRKS